MTMGKVTYYILPFMPLASLDKAVSSEDLFYCFSDPLTAIQDAKETFFYLKPSIQETMEKILTCGGVLRSCLGVNL